MCCQLFLDEQSQQVAQLESAVENRDGESSFKTFEASIMTGSF